MHHLFVADFMYPWMESYFADYRVMHHPDASSVRNIHVPDVKAVNSHFRVTGRLVEQENKVKLGEYRRLRHQNNIDCTFFSWLAINFSSSLPSLIHSELFSYVVGISGGAIIGSWIVKK